MLELAEMVTVSPVDAFIEFRLTTKSGCTVD